MASSSHHLEDEASRLAPGGRAVDRQPFVVPKVEFPEVTEEMAARYWSEKYGIEAPPPPQPFPRRVPCTRSNQKVSDEEFLKIVRAFARVPEEVEIRLPEDGETAENPPAGYFTCYEIFLTKCLLWFPIPGALVNFLAFHGVALAQLIPGALQRLVGLLVMGYELGVSMSSHHLRSMYKPKKTEDPRWSSLTPRGPGFVVRGLTSNFHTWRRHFYFIRLDRASVEADYVSRFQCEWGRMGKVLQIR